MRNKEMRIPATDELTPKNLPMKWKQSWQCPRKTIKREGRKKTPTTARGWPGWKEKNTVVADSMRSGRHLIGINCQGLHQRAIITTCVAAICLSSLPRVPYSRPQRTERHQDSERTNGDGREALLDTEINSQLLGFVHRLRKIPFFLLRCFRFLRCSFFFH